MREDKVKVIIDCDTGIDDMISFALSLASDKLDVIWRYYSRGKPIGG